MRYITFSGTNEKMSEEEFRDICDFTLSKILSKRICDKIILNVSYNKCDAEVGTNGYIVPLPPRHNPREFSMWIRSSKSNKNQIEIVIHELVHLKQYAKNEICPMTAAARAPFLKNLQIGKTVSYYNDPTEIEAYGRANGLCNMYIEHWSNNH